MEQVMYRIYVFWKKAGYNSWSFFVPFLEPGSNISYFQKKGRMNMQERLYEFLRGNKKNYNRKSIYDIWEYSLEELETDHHYIQWLFPLQKRSINNLLCPVVKDIRDIRDPEIIRNMKKSFERMLEFYGLEYTDGQVKETIYFKESLKRWCTPKNHNFLRITRILKSLKLFGLKKEAVAFFMKLRSIYRERYRIIGKNTYLYWKEAAMS